MTSSSYVNGGTPLVGEITVRGAKNFVSKAMVAALLGEAPSVLRNVPADPRRRRRHRAARAARRARRRRPPTPATLRPRPDATSSRRTSPTSTRTPGRAASRSCSAARCCTGSARRSSPTSAAAGSATGRSTTTSTSCAQFGAVVDKREHGIHIRAPRGLQGTKIALPYPSVGATEQLLLTAVRAEGITELRERGDRARDHGPHQRAAEDGRDHLGRHRPGDPDRGRRPARRVPAHRAVRPHRGGVVGVGGAGDRRRHHRRGAHAARDDDVPQHVPQGRRRVRRSTTTASGSSTPAGTCARSCSRPTCTPGS